MPQLGDRVGTFTDSVIRSMTRINNRYDSINLSQGFPDFDPPKQLLNETIRRLEKLSALLAGALQQKSPVASQNGKPQGFLCHSASNSGRQRVKQLPLPGSLCSRISPRCRCASSCAMVRPRPVESCLVSAVVWK